MLYQCICDAPEALSEAFGGHAWGFYWVLTGTSHRGTFWGCQQSRGKPLSLGGSVGRQSPATTRPPSCLTARLYRLMGHWEWKHRDGVESPIVSNEGMKVKSHLTEQRALSKTALICSSCPWSWLWEKGSCELGSWAIREERMLMYSDGGVMATKAFDAITLTLYIGLADSWSRGGRKEDNVLARAHESRLNSSPPLTKYK